MFSRNGPTNKPNSFGWLRLAVLTAAIAAIAFVATGATLWHVDTPGSAATCPICHVAHTPLLSGVSAQIVVAPFAVAWVVAGRQLIGHDAPLVLDASPRAPPSILPDSL
jgi:hypothetical protein